MSYDVRENGYTFKYVAEDNPEDNPDLSTEHFHTSYELLYFLRGSGDFVMQHNSYRLKPHTLLIIQPGAYHNLLLNPGSQYERVVLRFEEQDIPPPVRERLSALGGVYNIKGTTLSEELLRLAVYHREIRPGAVLSVFKSQLNIILSYLCQSGELSLRADHQNEDVGRIIAYISENLTQIQSLSQISSGLHMSKSLLQKRFSEHLNASVMSYVRTQKCMLAQSLLLRGVPATLVYLQCGFNEYSSFYRAYLKVFHRSPAGAPPQDPAGK